MRRFVASAVVCLLTLGALRADASVSVKAQGPAWPALQKELKAQLANVSARAYSVSVRVVETRAGRSAAVKLSLDNEVIAEETVTLPSKRQPKNDASVIAEMLRTRIEEADAPPPPPPPPEPPKPAAPTVRAITPTATDAPPARDSAAPVQKDHDPSSALLFAAIHGEALGRSFSYRDPITRNLRDYDVGGAWVVRGSLELYPLARATDDFLRHVGLVLDYARAIGFDSKTSDGRSVATTYEHFRIGLADRIRIGQRSRLNLGAAFGSESFRFDARATGDLAGSLASVSYAYLRPSVDARVAIGPVVGLGGIAYRFVVSGGDVSDRFPRSTVGALDIHLGAAIPIGKGFEAQIAAMYERYFYAMNPEVGDANVAGGALDQFFGGRAGVAYAY